MQTQLQAGSVLGTNCEQKYLNSGYSTLFASIIAYENDAAETFTINVSGSNDDVNYANIGMLSTTQNIVSIKNYKYIKLTCYNANGYGKKQHGRYRSHKSVFAVKLQFPYSNLHCNLL